MLVVVVVVFGTSAKGSGAGVSIELMVLVLQLVVALVLLEAEKYTRPQKYPVSCVNALHGIPPPVLAVLVLWDLAVLDARS